MSFLKNWLGRIYSTYSLRKQSRGCKSVKELSQLTFTWRGRGGCWSIRSLQVAHEMEEFFEQVSLRSPKCALEVGTCNGGTLFMLCQVADPKAHIMSIDLPGGIHGGGSTDNHARFMKAAFPKKSQVLHIIRDDSHSLATFHKAKVLLGGQKLDYLFIDGDHRYEGVLTDFVMYSQLVKSGGLIAFHDIVADAPTVEVSMLWKTIKSYIDCQEIISPQSSNQKYGIGVIPSWEPSRFADWPEYNRKLPL